MPDKGGPDAGPVPVSRTLTLCLGSGNRVLSYMGTPDAPIGKPTVSNFSKNGLRKTLISAKNHIKQKTGKDMILLLKPSDRSIYSDLVSSIDEANIVKIDRYAIVDIAAADVGMLKKYKRY